MDHTATAEKDRSREFLSLLKSFENKAPEIIFEWNDPETEARGWAVINSLRGGAAGGGTRMRLGLDKHEVISLAKTMEIKFTVSGPAIGGAKSGINFDPRDPRKEGVLKRWYKAVTPLLKNYYGTGGDLNVNEKSEVIPITESYGLWHPQEGVVNGHFRADSPEMIKKLEQLRLGAKKVIEDARYSPSVSRKFSVSDMITGWGVAESVKHFYSIWEGQQAGKKAIIQGWGNVASSAAYYLAKEGVRIVGIIDRTGGLIRPEGIGYEEIRDLYLNKKGSRLSAPSLLTFEETNEKIWDAGAEIFIPAAASRLVTKEQVERMVHNRLEVIACGANVPFANPEIFFGETAHFADERTAVIPDFIANSGMARTFSFLMETNAEVTDQAIFRAVSSTVKQALLNVRSVNPESTGLSKTAFKLAMDQLL
ncbi:MAG: amino acid dehydrogenase [Cytophagales bacterium]|nr:amino acid dehydrogenase [Cytophagales bacterium]